MRRAWGGGRELRLPQLAGESTTGSRWTNNWFVVRMVTKVRPRCSALAPLERGRPETGAPLGSDNPRSVDFRCSGGEGCLGGEAARGRLVAASWPALGETPAFLTNVTTIGNTGCL